MRRTVVYNSDLRLKNEITPIPNALEKVSALRGVNFKWRENCGSSGFHMGLIGQEVEKVFPELVTTDPDSMKSISYTELSAALVEAIKELKSQGEKEIARLTKENAALKKRLEAVEKKLNERL
jgi:cell shape-determining protein MreC